MPAVQAVRTLVGQVGVLDKLRYGCRDVRADAGLVAHRDEFAQFVAVGVNLYVAVGTAEHKIAHAPTQVLQLGRRQTKAAERLAGIYTCRAGFGAHTFDGNLAYFCFAVGIQAQTVRQRLHRYS